MTSEALVRRAGFYARLRWVGIALFCVGLVGLVGTAAAVATDRLGAASLLLSVFTLGISLGAFGTANDTALEALARLHSTAAVPEAHRAEWQHEASTRGARLRTLHAAPRAAFVILAVAAGANAWVAARLLAAWMVDA